MEDAPKCNCVAPQSDGSDTEGSPPTTKRRCCSKQRLYALLTSARASDIMFKVGEGDQQEDIPAHKALLLMGSDVLSTMFDSNWSAESRTIEIPDINPPAFRALLRFLYTDEVALTFETAPDILYAARKYEVRSLENQCLDFILKKLCPTNAFAALNQGRLFDINKLIDAALESIDADTTLAVTTDGFCQMTAKTLCLVLDRNTLTISEVALFEAIVRWSKAECARKDLALNQDNQRLVLDEILPAVRFPLMSAKEFSNKVTSTALLKKDDLLSMYRYFIEEPKPSVPFSDTPRFWKEVIIKRFKSCKLGRRCDGGTYAIYFTLNRDVHLMGFGMFCPPGKPARYEVERELQDVLTKKLLLRENSTHNTDGGSTTYRIFLKTPVKLIACKKYTLYTYTWGPHCLNGQEGLSMVTVDLPHERQLTVTFESMFDEEAPDLQTAVKEGNIPELIFAA